MAESVQQSDQRTSQRHHSKAGAMVSLKSNSSYRFGSIKDLSQGGLSFKYVEFGFNNNGDISKEDYMLEILFDICGFVLGPIPCNIISDTAHCSGRTSEMFSKRMCRVKFGTLKHKHKAKIEYFIDKFTV